LLPFLVVTVFRYQQATGYTFGQTTL